MNSHVACNVRAIKPIFRIELIFDDADDCDVNPKIANELCPKTPVIPQIFVWSESGTNSKILPAVRLAVHISQNP